MLKTRWSGRHWYLIEKQVLAVAKLAYISLDVGEQASVGPIADKTLRVSMLTMDRLRSLLWLEMRCAGGYAVG